MNKDISDKDKKDWEEFLDKNETLPNKDINFISKKNKTKLCDLKGYSLDEANKKVKELIFDSYENGFNKLTIVTGKGLHSKNEKDPYVSQDLGILKYSTVLASAKELGGMTHISDSISTKLFSSKAFGSTTAE